MAPRKRPSTQATQVPAVYLNNAWGNTTTILLAIAITIAVCISFQLALLAIGSSSNNPSCVNGICETSQSGFFTNCVTCQPKPTTPATNLQSLAQAEADEMRARRYKGHVGSTLGDFEGCGWTSQPNGLAPTCEPPNANYVLAADASSSDATGTYRVRAWLKR